VPEQIDYSKLADEARQKAPVDYAALAERARQNADLISPTTAIDMLTRPTSDTSDAPKSVLERLNEALQSSAHPQTVADMLPLLLPAGLSTAITAAKSYGSAAQEAIANGARMRQLPGAVLRILKSRALPTVEEAEAARRAVSAARVAPEIAQGAEQFSMPRAQTVVDRAPKAAQTIGEAQPMSVAEQIKAGIDQAVAEGKLRRGARAPSAPAEPPVLHPLPEFQPVTAPVASTPAAAVPSTALRDAELAAKMGGQGPATQAEMPEAWKPLANLPEGARVLTPGAKKSVAAMTKELDKAIEAVPKEKALTANERMSALQLMRFGYGAQDALSMLRQ